MAEDKKTSSGVEAVVRNDNGSDERVSYNNQRIYEYRDSPAFSDFGIEGLVIEVSARVPEPGQPKNPGDQGLKVTANSE